MLKWLKQMLVLNILLVPPMVFFPAIYLTLAAHPDPLAAQLCFWFGPLSAGFWVLVYSQWSSAMAWRRMGRVAALRHRRLLRRGSDIRLRVPAGAGWHAQAMAHALPLCLLLSAIPDVGLEAAACVG